MEKIFFTLIFCLMTSFAFAESYRTMDNGYVQRQSDLVLIPPTEKNLDYVKYLADKKAGAEIKPFDYETERQRQIIEQEKNKIKIEKEKLIQSKIRELAIAALKAEGKLEPNYIDKE